MEKENIEKKTGSALGPIPPCLILPLPASLASLLLGSGISLFGAILLPVTFAHALFAVEFTLVTLRRALGGAMTCPSPPCDLEERKGEGSGGKNGGQGREDRKCIEHFGEMKNVSNIFSEKIFL